MKTISKFVGAVTAGLLATTSVVFAAPNFVPEPSSLWLVGLGIAGVALFSRRGKK